MYVLTDTFNYVAVVNFEDNNYSVREIKQHLTINLTLNKPLSTDVTVQILTASEDATVGKLTVVCTYVSKQY